MSVLNYTPVLLAGFPAGIAAGKKIEQPAKKYLTILIVRCVGRAATNGFVCPLHEMWPISDLARRIAALLWSRDIKKQKCMSKPDFLRIFAEKKNFRPKIQPKSTISGLVFTAGIIYFVAGRSIMKA